MWWSRKPENSQTPSNVVEGSSNQIAPQPPPLPVKPAAPDLNAQINLERAKQLKVDRKIFFDLATDVIDISVNNHVAVLISKFKRLVYKDEFGRSVKNQWVDELALFYEDFCYRKILDARSPFDISWMKRRLDEPGVQEGFVEYIDVSIEWKARESHGSDNPSSLSPAQYEVLCARELESIGWKVTISAGAGDQGVDIVARKAGKTAVLQCKLYSSPLGNSPVQEIHTGRLFYSADIAAVVSNADYTPGARAAANQANVMLLHHSELKDVFGPNVDLL